MEGFSPSAHWRDSARAARFFLIDYRAAFPILLFLLHIRWWTFFTALFIMTFLAIVERYGFRLNIFLRWLRATLAGPRKFAIPWWKE